MKSVHLPYPKAMLFDLDGTLFRTETLLLPAYHATFEQLRAEGLYTGDTPPEERILSGLGMILEQIWSMVMPGVSPETHRRADTILLDKEREGLRRGLGELYAGVRDTLPELRRRGIRLFVASNGLEDYVKEVLQSRGIAHCFEGVYSAGEYQTRSKADLVRLLMERHRLLPQETWMVGDRSSDVEAGHGNGLSVVGCDYAGFRENGELDNADVRIASFTELLTLLEP